MSLEELSRPESLSEMALRSLRDAIIDGRLKLGDRFSEARLSKMLGISKTPVREALQELRREGLVQIDAQRGTTIFRIEDSEVDQISDFREILEVAAGRRLFSGDRKQACRRLRATVDAMQKALKQKEIATYRKLDFDFHRILIESCGNAYIVNAYGLISAKIGALRTRAHDDREVVDRSLSMHSRMIKMLEAGEEEEFCRLLARHIQNAGRDYRSWLSRQRTEDAKAEQVPLRDARETQVPFRKAGKQ